ncbi:MAG: hypothetical protein CMJ64_22070 [Planctomycetaceae bacterium]|nr:hypothetical protein [Planctomycetaceae bacterium]
MEQPITFIADERGKFTGDKGQVVVVAPDEEAWSCRFLNADHTRLAGFRFSAKAQDDRQGVYVYNTSGLHFDDCLFDGLTSGLVARLSDVTLNGIDVQACKPRAVVAATGRLTAIDSRFARNHAGVHTMSDVRFARRIASSTRTRIVELACKAA